MAEILCAIRGGEASRAVQNAAVGAARRAGDRLGFLYVIALRIIESTDEALQPYIRNELYWMGKTVLRTAANRARIAGLSPVDLLIREGHVSEEIARAVNERSVGCLYIGATRDAVGHIAAQAEHFATQLRESTGVAVEIVPVPGAPDPAPQSMEDGE